MATQRQRSERRAWYLLQDRIATMTEAQLQAVYDTLAMPTAPKLHTALRRVLREHIAEIRERRRDGWPERQDPDAELDDDEIPPQISP